MQTEAHPKKRTGLTVGAWVAVAFGAVFFAAAEHPGDDRSRAGE